MNTTEKAKRFTSEIAITNPGPTGVVIVLTPVELQVYDQIVLYLENKETIPEWIEFDKSYESHEERLELWQKLHGSYKAIEITGRGITSTSTYYLGELLPKGFSAE